MYPFRRLAVWRRAHALALVIHEVTERAYRGRYAALINQMRRASMSIPANIAEGSGQDTKPQFARYLTIALGSARELDYHTLLAKDLGLLPPSDYVRLEARTDQVCRMLAGLRLRVQEEAEAATKKNRSEFSRRSPTSAFHRPTSRPQRPHMNSPARLLDAH